MRHNALPAVDELSLGEFIEKKAMRLESETVLVELLAHTRPAFLSGLQFPVSSDVLFLSVVHPAVLVGACD